MSVPAVIVEHVCKRYGDVQAVDDLSFEVAPGAIFGLLGPNGAGKTTALEIAEGLREPDSGRALLLGEPSWPRNQRLLPRIGVQLQTSAFFDRLTVREQLRVFATLYGAPPSSIRRTIAAVGLEEKADAQVQKLSGGQAQRLAIACALVHDPELVFLDEPSAGLDPQSRRNLWDVIVAIRNRGATVVLTTHAMDEAEALCDTVAIVDQGRLLALDAPALLVRSLDAPVRVLVPRDALDPAEAAGLPGVEASDSDAQTTELRTRSRETVLRALDQRGLLGLAEVRGATLEDVFFALTGRAYRT